MSSFIRFAHLVRRRQPVTRDTSFTSTWRDAAGRSNAIGAPTARLVDTVAAAAAMRRIL